MTKIGISEDDRPGPSLAGNPAAGNPDHSRSADIPDEDAHTPDSERPLSTGAPPTRKVRPAGPEGMATPPEDWDELDQASDESFPASDPSGTSPGSD